MSHPQGQHQQVQASQAGEVGPGLPDGPPDGPPAIKVGVLLPREPDNLGEWLADGAAFEAAGADALWVNLTSLPQLDPLALTAALAAVTFRSLLVATLPAPGLAPEALARTLATIGQLSHGRLSVFTDATPAQAPADLGPGLGLFRRMAADPAGFEHTREPAQPERWLSAPSPEGRVGWRATLHDAAERGYRGVLVPAGPRLIDILRNPDEPGERHDLLLAQG